MKALYSKCSQYSQHPICMNAVQHEGEEHVALLRCSGRPGCGEPSLRLYCWFWCLSVFLLTRQVGFSLGFRSGEFAGQSNTVELWLLNQGLVLLPVCTKKSLTSKVFLGQREAWSAIKCPGNAAFGLDIRRPTQQITWVPKPSLIVKFHTRTATNLDCVS